METKQTNPNKNFVITKRIAKHGAQAVIVIPSILKNQINHGMLVKVTIDVLDNDVKFAGGEA
jgi:hypothetical protein